MLLLPYTAMHAAAQNTFPATGSSVGIGTIAPQDKLDVNGTALFGPLLEKINIGSGSLRFNRRVVDGAIYDSGFYAYQFQQTRSSSSSSDYLGLQVYSPSGFHITQSALAFTGSGQVAVNTSYVPQVCQLAINRSMITTSVINLSKNNYKNVVKQIKCSGTH